MTRKDYVAVANEVRIVLEGAPTGGTNRERQAWKNGVTEVVMALAEVFEKDNPQFRPGTFYQACGLEIRLIPDQ